MTTYGIRIDNRFVPVATKNKNGYTSDFYPSASVTDWGASCDLKADVAMHLIVKKSKEKLCFFKGESIKKGNFNSANRLR